MNLNAGASDQNDQNLRDCFQKINGLHLKKSQLVHQLSGYSAPGKKYTPPGYCDSLK